MRDSYSEFRKPLLGGYVNTFNRYALAAFVGSLLLLLGVCMHDFLPIHNVESSVSKSDRGQVWPSEFLNDEVPVGPERRECLDGDDLINFLLDDFGHDPIEQPRCESQAGPQDAVPPSDEPTKLWKGKYYKSKDECRKYEQQFNGHVSGVLGGRLPCTCEQYTEGFFWQLTKININKPYWICKSDCSAHQTEKACTDDPVCEVRPSGGERYFYCAKVAECYKKPPTDDQIADAKLTPEAREARGGWEPTEEIRRDTTFFNKDNCVETCGWVPIVNDCWPSDLQKLWKIFTMSQEAELARRNADAKLKKLDDQILKHTCDNNEKCFKAVQALAGNIADWSLLNQNGQCRLREYKATDAINNNNCPLEYSGCTTMTNVMNVANLNAGVCSELSNWKWKCLYLRSSPILATFGYLELAPDLLEAGSMITKSLAEASEWKVEYFMKAFDPTELGVDFHLERGEVREEGDAAESINDVIMQQSKVMKARQQYNNFATSSPPDEEKKVKYEWADKVVGLLETEFPEKTKNQLILYSDFTIASRHAHYYDTMLASLIEAVSVKSAFMAAHFHFAATKAPLIKAGAVLGAKITAPIIAAGWATSSMAISTSENSKSKHKTIEKCPILKERKPDFTAQIGAVKTQFAVVSKGKENTPVQVH